MHLRPETSTYIRRNDPQPMFGDTDCLGDPAPVHVRHLTGKIDRHAAINTGCRKNGTGLEASRNEPVVDQAQSQYLIRFGEPPLRNRRRRS